jgi:hypothetical protein
VVESTSPLPTLSPAAAASKVLWSAESGQPGAGRDYSPPLSGRPEPLGASYDEAMVGALCQVISMAFCSLSSLDAATYCSWSAVDCKGGKSSMAQNLILPRGQHESRSTNICHCLASLQAGVNFAIVAPSAQAVTLVLFTEVDLMQGRSTHEIQLDPEANRTGDVWHILLPSMNVDLLYGKDHCGG